MALLNSELKALSRATSFDPYRNHPCKTEIHIISVTERKRRCFHSLEQDIFQVFQNSGTTILLVSWTSQWTLCLTHYWYWVKVVVSQNISIKGSWCPEIVISEGFSSLSMLCENSFKINYKGHTHSNIISENIGREIAFAIKHYFKQKGNLSI